MQSEPSTLNPKEAGAKPDLDDADQCRHRAASQIQSHEIQSADAESLSRLKALAGHGVDLNHWTTPKHWLVHGSRIEAIESVDLRAAALAGLTGSEQAMLDTRPVAEAAAALGSRLTPSHIIDSAVLQAVRYLLLLRLGPSAGSSKASTGSLKAGSIAITASGAVRRMLELVVRKRMDLLVRGLLAPEDRRNFSLLQRADFTILPATFKEKCEAELRRMNRLCGRELWDDGPLPERDPTMTVDPTKSPLTTEPERIPDPHLPLPDDYVAQMGQRSLWIIEHLGPVLMDVGEQLLGEWRQSAARGSTSKDTRKKIALKVLSQTFSRKAKDAPSRAQVCPPPPFLIRLSTHGEVAGRLFKKDAAVNGAADTLDAEAAEEATEEVLQVAWPPRNLAHFTGLCGVLQGAHLFLASMAMAARQSESMDLRRDCVVYGKDGQWRAIGRTFKLVQKFDGESREWELPEVVARALEQQARLVRLLEQMPWSEDLSALLNGEFNEFVGDHLWCRLGTGQTDPREVPRDPNKVLRKFARALNMAEEPGGQPLRTHRFRKTIARLAALAIDEAPVMLKTLFGHKDIEMTLHYILADKGLAAEIEQVVRELHMMRAKAPVEAFVAQLVTGNAAGTGADEGGIDYAGYGGKAVARIADTVTRYREQAVASGRMRNSVDDFGADQIDDVVRILTADGTYFNVVRPGVACTKRLGEWGPCSRGKGLADRSNCQESCDHRLEEPWLRADADGCVEEALAAYERASADLELLLMSFWGEQVRRNVIRFEDLRAKWMRHPTVAQLMAPAATQAAHPA
jgi:hypothetical protein